MLTDMSCQALTAEWPFLCREICARVLEMRLGDIPDAELYPTVE